MMKILPLLAASTLLIACGRSEPGDQPAAAATDQALAAPPREPISEGARWRRVRSASGPALQFGEAGSRPHAAIRCDAEMETLLIERMTAAPAPAVERMKISVEGRSRTYPVVWDRGSEPVASAMVKLEDGMTDSLSRVSGSIEISLGDEDPLTLPADRRVGTLIEECRQA